MKPILTLCILLCVTASCAEDKPNTTRPNVLFISVDDLNDFPTFA